MNFETAGASPCVGIPNTDRVYAS